jgi:hypothetical protein
MPLTDVSGFSPSNDLHLLRGQPAPRLSELLQVEWGTAPGVFQTGTLADYLNQNPHPQDVDVEFRPMFQFDRNGDVLEKFNIHIQNTTGAITVDLNAPPDPSPHNFIIEATVTRNDLGPAPDVFKPVAVRVHVHRNVVRIWLTPEQLSVRRLTAAGRDETLYNFTVRAEFDDGIVADITSSDRYAPIPADTECFAAGNRVVIPASLAAGAPPREITFGTTPEWNSVEAKAKIAALAPWNDPNTQVPQAELMSGHPRVLDGTLAPEKVPNLVFLPSGFTAADQNAFVAITDSLVHRLRNDPQLRPYPYLARAMNFWRIPVVSPQAGVCVRMEVYPFEKNGQLFALPLPRPERPSETDKWQLAHLIYVAGLPMPGDKVGQVTTDKIRERWALTILAQFVPLLNDHAVVPDMLVEAWQRCAGRTFIDETDNFPAISVGGVPDINDEDDVGIFDYYGLRAGALETDPNTFDVKQSRERRAFFERVSAKPKNGITLELSDAPKDIGRLWAEMRDSFAFDQRFFVIDLCNMPTGHVAFGRGRWGGITGLVIRPTLRVPTDIALITNETTLPGLPVVKDPIRNALKFSAPQLDSMELLDQAWQTVAHEIGHALGLGDEYSGRKGATLIPDPSNPFLRLDYSNLMTAVDVLKADKITVDVGKIKWNWHRIRAASLIIGPINPRGGEVYEIPVAPKSGFRFKAGDPVLLRQRARLKVFPNDLTTSGECKVESVSADGSTVVISRAAGGTLDLPQTFFPGSILFAPLPAPPELVPHRTYLTLVSPLSERIMDAIGGALGGKTCNNTDKKVYRAPVQAPAVPSQVGDAGPLNALPRIVGVYYGGAEFACGVVHPAGSCQMRNGFNAFTHFCHVCQYALVDQVDPEQHGLVDSDYAKFYTL